jgi:predicted nuclease with TOPRIM domain
MTDFEAVAGRLAYRIGQLEFEKAQLQAENENVRSLMAGLENRVKELENGRDLPSFAVATPEQHSDGAVNRSAEASDLAHDGGIPWFDGDDVSAGRVHRN